MYLEVKIVKLQFRGWKFRLRYVARVSRAPTAFAADCPPHHSPFVQILQRNNQWKPVDMLDAFEIFTTSGVVLWSRSYAPVGAHVINSLINDVFVEEKVQGRTVDGVLPVYKKEKYSLKWKRVEEFGLVFVVRCADSMLIMNGDVDIMRTILGRLSISSSSELDRQASG